MPLRSQGPEAGAGSERPSARLSPASAKRGCLGTKFEQHLETSIATCQEFYVC